jgi:hypothetical protein
LTPRRTDTDQTVSPGWKTDFSDYNDFLLFTTYDVAGDRVDNEYGTYGAWEYGYDTNKNACVMYNYEYTMQNEADDWLVTPGVKLTTGDTYYFKFKNGAYAPAYPERMAVTVANDKSLAAVSSGTVLMQPTTIDYYPYAEQTLSFTPKTDGVYYFAIHCISDAYMSTLLIDDVSFSVAPKPQAPAAVSDINITPDATGANKATISLTAPSKTFGGDALTSINQIIAKDGNDNTVATVDKPEPGSTVNMNVSTDSAGIYTYTIYATNEFGDGALASASKYIGLDVPSKPSNGVLTYDPKNIKVSWDASTAANGGVFFPEKVKYDIHTLKYDEFGWDALGDSVTSVTGKTTASLNYGADEGEPKFLYMTIKASNESGTSGFTTTSSLLVGAPYKAPYYQSFAHADWGKDFITIGCSGDGVMSGYSGNGINPALDADGDGGCFTNFTGYSGDLVGFYIFKLNIANTTNPKLMYKQTINADSAICAVFVRTPNDDDVFLETAEIHKSIVQGINVWELKSFDLSAYKDKPWIQIGFELYDRRKNITANNTWSVDNIHIGDIPESDMTLTVKPEVASISKGSATDIIVNVVNNGTKAVDKYNVNVKVGDKVIADETVTNHPLQPFEYASLRYNYLSSILDANDSAKVVASVSLEGDANTDNNEATSSVYLITSDAITASNLTVDGSSVSWKAPSVTKDIVDSFEKYEDWTIGDSEGYVGGWKLVDIDGASAGSIYNYCTYPNQDTPVGFIIANPTNFNGFDATSMYSQINAHSGNKTLLSIFGYYSDGTYADVDDWAISPTLYGGAQTITFYAKNFPYIQADGSDNYPTTFQVLTTTGNGTDTNDFTKVYENTLTGGVYQPISVDLPAGTTHFAIRNVTKAQYSYALIVDDAAFTINNDTVAGYNVFRDGTKIGYTKDTSLTDNISDGLSHVYAVTVVYTNGIESAPIYFNTISSGINTVETENTKEIYSINGIKLHNTVKGINIINGKKVMVK